MNQQVQFNEMGLDQVTPRLLGISSEEYVLIARVYNLIEGIDVACIFLVEDGRYAVRIRGTGPWEEDFPGGDMRRLNDYSSQLSGSELERYWDIQRWHPQPIIEIDRSATREEFEMQWETAVRASQGQRMGFCDQHIRVLACHNEKTLDVHNCRGEGNQGDATNVMCEMLEHFEILNLPVTSVQVTFDEIVQKMGAARCENSAHTP